MTRKIVVTLILIVAGTGISRAQRYPATASIQLIPPYSVHLEDYAAPGMDRLLITAAFNDFSQPAWDVKLRITISGQGIRLQTHPDAPLQPIRLTPGQMEQYAGADLGDYFSYHNMAVTGIGPAQLQARGLPEGVYNFTVEILDYNTGTPISNKAVATAMLMLNDPPQLTLPACGSRITDTDPQNILFQWLPLHHGSPNSTFTTTYELTLTEVPPGLSPDEAVRSALPLYQTVADANTFQYDVTAPLLENGKTYAYRVRATDPENLGLFKNDGYSNTCWFTFGFDTNGRIELQAPAHESVVKSDARLVFAWGAPDNLGGGQLMHYAFKLVKAEEGQDIQEAMLANPSFYEETFPESAAGMGWSFQLPVALETESRYAWQVAAQVGEVEIATSAVFALNASPKIAQFNAGQHIVKIRSLDNEDLDNLSGTGSVILATDGTAYEVTFSNLKLSLLAGKLFLKEGAITQTLPEQFPDIPLAPAEKANGEAVFYPESVYLDKNALEISGHVAWPLPFPQVSGEEAFVRSVTGRLNFDSYKLNGYIKLDSSNRYQLLDPYGFDLSLLPSSDFFIREDRYTQHFNAGILLPEEVRSLDGKRVMVKLDNVQQLFTNEVSTTEQPIAPVHNLAIEIIPEKLHVDLSGVSSPGRFAKEPLWTGVYFEDFRVRYAREVDGRQLSLDAPVTHTFSLRNTDFRAWADGDGLDFAIEKTFEQTQAHYARFNKFYGRIHHLDLAVEDGFVKEGSLGGAIHIPFLKGGYFDYIIPISHEGFEEGYLVEELAGKTYILNEGHDDEVAVTIARAVFDGHDKLDMTVDMEWSGVGVKTENVPDFRIWGNGDIGYGRANGQRPLPDQKAGSLYGYPVVAHTAGAGLAGDKYYLKLTADITLAEDISGKNGAPEIDIYSAMPAGLNEYENDIREGEGIARDEAATSDLFGAGGVWEGDNVLDILKGALLVDSVYIQMDVGLASMAGHAKLTLNDPYWGHSLHGSLKGEVRVPISKRVNATLVLGLNSETPFFFFDTGFGLNVEEKDKKLNIANRAGSNRNGTPEPTRVFKDIEEQKRGIPMGPLSITGFDLRFYARMSHTDPATISESGAGGPVAFKPDPSNNYGVYGRVAARDLPTQGEAFNFDLGFEYSETKGGASRYAFEGNVTVGSNNDSDQKRAPKGKKGRGPTLGTGSGKLIYDEAEQHWLGDFWLVVNRGGVLCAEGGLAFSARPGYWKVALGNEDRMIMVTPGCKGASYTGYLIFDPNQFELGLGVGWVLNLKSPTKEIFGNEFAVKLDVGYTAGFKAGIQVKPTFAIQKAGVWVDMWAALAVEYSTWFESGTWTIASAGLHGMVTLYFEPQKRFVGKLSGEVEVLGFDLGFDMHINETF